MACDCREGIVDEAPIVAHISAAAAAVAEEGLSMEEDTMEPDSHSPKNRESSNRECLGHSAELMEASTLTRPGSTRNSRSARFADTVAGLAPLAKEVASRRFETCSQRWCR